MRGIENREFGGRKEHGPKCYDAGLACNLFSHSVPSWCHWRLLINVISRQKMQPACVSTKTLEMAGVMKFTLQKFFFCMLNALYMGTQ